MRKRILFLLISALLVISVLLADGCLGKTSTITPAATNTTTETSTPAPTGSPTAVITATTSPATTATPVVTRPKAPLTAPELVVRVEPSVVTILTESTQTGFFGRQVTSQAAGTGIIFTTDGYILTNNHVVEGADSIKVILDDNEQYDASIVGREPLNDLAVIKISPKSSLTPAAFGDSSKLVKGEDVVAIGNALNLPGGPTVTKGIVSYLGRSIETDSGVVLEDLIQTDAAINPGNSGGPLLNMYGEVVGINTAIASQAEGIGFAISSDTAIPIRDSLKANGRVVWPWIGVGVDNLTAAKASELNLSVNTGVLIMRVYQGYPAQKAGLLQNDVITAFEKQPVTDMTQLKKLTRQHKVGDKVEITYVRGKDTRTVQVTLAEMPSQ